ncbi:hypothetical protein [Thermus caldilimi]|uniref:hypothetical protein n=1 Tax=Thermus caldilimi TaxID=2483360 RepID=UPI00107669C8|nr:hypothetical protein [Thermus caldilimi]
MWSPWWDPGAGKGRYEELFLEAERERLLKPLRSPWRLRLARVLLRWAQRLAQEAPAELGEVSYGG